jgi:hypothetical protein
MDAEFLPYKESLALKELGFDEPCMCFYNNRKELKVYHNVDKDWDTLEHQLLGNSKITLPNTYSAPTFSQAFRWFREKYNLREQYGVFPHHTIMINYLIEGGREEEAELACLKNLIEIVNQQTHATTN